MDIASIYANAWYKVSYEAYNSNNDTLKSLAEKLWQKYLVYYKMIPAL